jgi:hypothetical protein
MLCSGGLFSRYCGERQTIRLVRARSWPLSLEFLDPPPTDEQDPVVHTAASTPVLQEPIAYLSSAWAE